MGRAYSLVDIDFGNLSKDEKRESFVMMDVALKQIHSKNFKVDSFNASDIYYEDGYYFYSKVSPINYSIEDKNNVVLDNIEGLSNLAFCSFLPSYDLKNGLLNSKVVSDQFNKFESIFDSSDKEYYKSVLVDSYNANTLPDPIYYSDYIMNKEKNNGGNGNKHSNAYVKATQAGKLYADSLNENAFGKTFFFACMVTTMMIAFIGLAFLFLK